MKNLLLAFIMLIIVLPHSDTNAQIWKRLKEKAEKKVEKNLEEKMEEKIDESMDGKKSDPNNNNTKKKKENQIEEQQIEKTELKQANKLEWSKYDFIPGDDIIFDDMPTPDEENGEFPSRWDLVKGQVEIAKFNGETVIMFIDGNPEIIPFIKDAKEDYLPDVFTLEFDIYKPGSSNRITFNLFDRKNQKRENNQEITVSYNYLNIGKIRGTYPKNIDPDKSRWIHVSLAYTKGKLKVYMDDTRLINIPRYKGNPTGFSIQCYWADAEHLYYLKNLRIAKGGVKYYDRVLNDGRIVTHGIKFDVGNSILKPESMGVINNIFEIMQKNTDINFSIEGHTDSDGDDDMNKSLSEQRALAVMNKLIEMGVKSNRLQYKGMGETVPLAENSTAEGKAQNRRVEFVKF